MAVVPVLVLFVAILSETAHAAEPAELFAGAASGSSLTVDHSDWDALLRAYVRPSSDGLNRVDYAAFKTKGQAKLKQYIRRLEATVPAILGRPEQFALLVNLYNAKTIDIVLDHYPVKSIKDISLGGSLFASIAGGPWKANVLKIQGVELSLDDIEHAVLRPVFRDPRVHYAVNCASIGCPNLQSEAFTGAKLNAQLDAAAKAYVNHPRGAAITDRKLAVSSIYIWFQSDFGGSDDGVIRHLKAYAAPGLADELNSITEIDSHSYDWRLNDTQG